MQPRRRPSRNHAIPTGSRTAALRAGVLACLAALPLAALPAAPGHAAQSAWERTPETAVRLIAATTAVGSETSLPAGIEFRLQPGWKTYWRSPGDAGLPPTVDWSGSTNLARADLAWPAPHRFTLFGLDTFGYEDEVVFPVAVLPERPGEPVALRATVDYLVCEEICIPYHAVLALDLPAGPAAPSDHVQLIDRFMAQVPGDGAKHGLTLERIAIAGSVAAPRLEITARSAALPFERPDLMVEGPVGLHFAAPEVTLEEGGAVARLSLPVGIGDGAPALTDAALTLTLVDGARGLERQLAPGAIAAPTPAALWPMLLLALLGGLILNLMPCVLPVLSLKLLDVVGHGGGDRAAVRASFLASAAGILFSFLVLAAALVGVKAAGVAVGWGIQFQQPLFLVAIVLLLTLFACNLWGWFEIPLPGWLGGLAPVAGGAGRGLGGHFLTGAFATLLATPCSAPFLGTAVGFALSRGATEILAIFAALGIGLALPYLLVAALPALAMRLPRPGRWMQVLRALLGFLLAATAIWLLSVLAAQLDGVTALLIGGAMAAVAGALWARRWLPAGLRLATPAAVVVPAIAAFALPGQALRPAPAADVVDEAGLWQPFDPARIPALVAEGRLVFVDVTADWCITCQVSKRLVLNSAALGERLRDPRLVAMRADWTRPDDGIARYLASFGRYGIPFNAVYGPLAADGLALPELLTKGAVFDALEAAGG